MVLQPASSISITWEPVRNAEGQAPVLACQVRICILTRFSDDSHTHLSLRSTIVGLLLVGRGEHEEPIKGKIGISWFIGCINIEEERKSNPVILNLDDQEY